MYGSTGFIFGQLTDIAGNSMGMPAAGTLRALEQELWKQFPLLQTKSTLYLLISK
ncbi:hypothetical protein LWM68_06625 [Niabella sp. W65]|nr:hypothetical protein [Niabella sp. W65]MCH7362470.1 hypothetical protein [Niabella sp. W65]ULT38427.1 hypothetical protein KRR40_25265 [Niabella sp. I65]